jgi:hypothetical protein
MFGLIFPTYRGRRWRGSCLFGLSTNISHDVLKILWGLY